MSALTPNCQLFSQNLHHKCNNPQKLSNGLCLFLLKDSKFGLKNRNNITVFRKMKKMREIKAYSSLWSDLSKPSSVELIPIKDCDHFDQILQQAKEDSQPIVVDWMANWCRKCIYLKPKLEKMAADYDTKFKFYYVDVNSVPQALVKRGNISKMPTIQLWQDGEMKAEVIGGHKAWLVMEEVKEMIEKFI